jgi:hypothetical protein
MANKTTSTTDKKEFSKLNNELRALKKEQKALNDFLTKTFKAAESNAFEQGFAAGFETGALEKAQEFETIAAEIRKAEKNFERTYKGCDFLKGHLLSDEEVTIIASQSVKKKPAAVKKAKKAAPKRTTTKKAPAQPKRIEIVTENTQKPAEQLFNTPSFEQPQKTPAVQKQDFFESSSFDQFDEDTNESSEWSKDKDNF